MTGFFLGGGAQCSCTHACSTFFLAARWRHHKMLNLKISHIWSFSPEGRHDATIKKKSVYHGLTLTREIWLWSLKRVSLVASKIQQFDEICSFSPKIGYNIYRPTFNLAWMSTPRFTLTCQVWFWSTKRVDIRPQNSTFGQICGILPRTDNVMHRWPWNSARKSIGLTQIRCRMPDFITVDEGVDMGASNYCKFSLQVWIFSSC